MASILVVDDDKSVRTTVAMLLQSQAHSVTTAENGFDALLQMKTAVPDMVISDLNMPQMSGFEFLSVIRRRFPKVQVVATSGDFRSGDAVPGGVIADAFHPKGGSPGGLLKLVADLLSAAASKPTVREMSSAPVWVPQNGCDSSGLPYVVLTCTSCLRSFPVNTKPGKSESVNETSCAFCAEPVRYVIDSSCTAFGQNNQALARGNFEH
jgi:CheY-like chemotaxis protein